MTQVIDEALLDLLDDALDEIEQGEPGLYSDEERAAYLPCSVHWQRFGELTTDDVAFLLTQLNDFAEEEDNHA